MKKATGWIALLLMLTLCGCTNVTTPKTADRMASQTEITTKTESESEPASFSAGETVSKSENEPENTTAAAEPAEEKTAEQVQSSTKVADKPTRPPVTAETPKETPKQTAPTAKPDIPPETKPVETKPVETKPKPTEPPEVQPPVTEAKPQGFTKADHDRIIAEVTAYADSYKAKGYTFIWLDSMEFSWEVGYMGTPRIARDGVNGVIRSLKHHIDLIVKTTTDPANGITCDEMTYKVMQIDLDGEIAFVVVYGG